VHAIEQLDPGDDFFYGSRERRSFTILWNRYVEMLSIESVLAELGLSRRQFHRDHTRAVESLANALWHSWQPAGRSQPPAMPLPEAAVAQAEAVKLVAGGAAQEHWLPALLADALQTLDPLLKSSQTHIQAELPDNLPPVAVVRVAARQILLQLLTQIFNAAPQGKITITGTFTAQTVSLEIVVENVSAQSPANLGPDANMSLAICRELAELNGGSLEFSRPGASAWQSCLTLPRQKPVSVLIIDDSEELIALFRRYLAGTRYQLNSARNAREAFEQISACRPNLITLDIMMPDQDGYEVLQRLRQQPDSRHTPVIVCSIIADPGLARSLGADWVLKKPVSRQDLLDALARLAPEPPLAAATAKNE
jgi:CheY-like chemotaxis protein